MREQETQPMQVVFGDNLSSVTFMLDGIIADPRLVLQALAANVVQVNFSQEKDGFRIKSETYTLTPKP